ncbi:alpha-D-ribose 1-methylphosphonate 5-triphosphate synthase subunit PhnI [Desulfacinum hydrothermale DSM 13146]|uniref:Alpha-D-ribose 1-methylphosphonate 5-triphosphate synthase subunit PhnI n=1 Tax=Desulfacinum hydrothermale DSM 13146 TaxID=1121390 RepID=A0A1W1XI46_9BACT|nr:carbon-phosphorus lyase complex subunit PhnI [Desulfacinum hydrothermale]SMC23639.1 alpha-D-ribose 1-methylphosphonate 5-triphosphate synthase subunit PhnI [Desulfacinum hydrothermale DSM 13146]
MYVAAKGGEKAIANAHRFLAEKRRGNPQLPEMSVEQIREQLGLAVDRVMAEGSLYDRNLAALAVKQAQGDLVEAAFLLRAYRTTLPRFSPSPVVDTGSMRVLRRISAAYKDLPGGQVLGPTYDYSHRLLDFSLMEPEAFAANVVYLVDKMIALPSRIPRLTEIVGSDDLVETPQEEPDQDPPVPDITEEPLEFPASRSARLQALARGDEGFLLGLAYSAQRGFGFQGHPFVGEIRMGYVPVEVELPGEDVKVRIGSILVTECTMLSRAEETGGCPFGFVQGYGLVFGANERKAMAMALVDRALRSRELGEEVRYPAQDEEYVLRHCDNVESSGFVQHLKLPHYVDFQAELVHVRRRDVKKSQGADDQGPSSVGSAGEG